MNSKLQLMPDFPALEPDPVNVQTLMTALMVIEEAASDLPPDEQEILRRALARLKVTRQ